MGDRSHVIFCVSREYRKDIVELLDEPVAEYESQVGRSVEMEWDEVNYGGQEEHEQLLAKKFPHIMRWAAGESYDAGSLCFDGEDVVEVAELDVAGYIVVTVNSETGEIHDGQLEEAQAFLRMHDKLHGEWEGV